MEKGEAPLEILSKENDGKSSYIDHEQQQGNHHTDNHNIEEIWKSKRKYNEINNSDQSPLALFLLILEQDYDALMKLKLLAEDNQIAKVYLTLIQTFGSKILPSKVTKPEEIIDLHANIDYESAEYLYLLSIFSEYGFSTTLITHLNSWKWLVGSSEIIQSHSSSSNQLTASILCDLGYEYLLGARIPSNYNKAFEYFSRGYAIDPDHSTVTNNLGYCYLHGIGVVADPMKALELFLKSALQGNINSQHNIGYCLQYLKDQGSLQSSNSDLQQLQQQQQQQQSSLYWYRISADSGSSYSQFRLGYCYQYGLEGLDVNISIAIHYYTLSAEQNNSFGQYCLGYCHQRCLIHRYYTKTRQQESEKNAFDLYLASACQGNPYGLHGLGQCFQHGIWVKRNITEANRIYSLIHHLPKLGLVGNVVDHTILSSLYPHSFYSEHIICHPTYQSFPSSTYPNLFLKIHQPYYLWDMICQYGYTPYLTMLHDYALRGCLLSAGSLLHLYYENFLEYFPVNSLCHDTSSTSGNLSHLIKLLPSIISELSGWLQEIGDQGDNDQSPSPPPHVINYSYLRSYLHSIEKYCSTNMIDSDDLILIETKICSPFYTRNFFHSLSDEVDESSSCFSSKFSHGDISFPIHYDTCLELLHRTSPQQHQQQQDPLDQQDPPNFLCENFQKLRKSSYLPARYLVSYCSFHGLYGYEKDMTVAREYYELCLLYGMKKTWLESLEWTSSKDQKKDLGSTEKD